MLYNILNTKVFICGSIHMLPKDAAALPSYINNILEVSDNCVFESNSDNFTEPNFFRYPNNETLEQHVPISLLNALACLCKNTGIAYKLLLPLKIWRVSQLLSQLLNAKAGNFPEIGIDLQLQNVAKQKYKSISFLESSDDLGFFDSIPISEQISQLEFIISDPRRPIKIFNQLYEAWKLKNIKTLEDVLQMHFDLFPVTFHLLIKDRNQKWLTKILNIIKSRKRSLITIGALHLVGEYSLQKLLKQHNYNFAEAKF